MRDKDERTELKVATLESRAGLRVSVLNLGATICSLEVPTASGPANVVLSYPDIDDYASDPFFLGTTVGPFANRIDGARFELGGEEFHLDANESSTGHCLHGGSEGLHRQFFDIQTDSADSKIECRCDLPDGHGGFPGNRTVTVIYRLVNELALTIDFRATTDRDTTMSIANHAYFNLGGPIADHELSIVADAYTPTHNSDIPTGEIRSVAETDFDWRSKRKVGDACFNHNFVLSTSNNEPQLAARLGSAGSGVELNLHTTQPGLQFYTGDFLERPFEARQGLCLEAQGFPDAPNQPRFPSARLSAGEGYWQRTIYEFIV